MRQVCGAESGGSVRTAGDSRYEALLLTAMGSRYIRRLAEGGVPGADT